MKLNAIYNSFIHQHVVQHWKWITKKSRQLNSSIDLTQRFSSSPITRDITPLLIWPSYIQTIFISTMIVWLRSNPFCVSKMNGAALPNPMTFLENRVIQMKNTQSESFIFCLTLIFCVKSILASLESGKWPSWHFQRLWIFIIGKFQLWIIAKFFKSKKITAWKVKIAIL